MLKLRILIGITIWWLFLFFNIERIDSTLNITPFVYVLVPVAAVGLTLIPSRIAQRSPLFTITPVLIAYIILKRAMGYALFERALAVTVTEITGIVLTLLIVREVLLIVRNFEDAVADITFRQLGLPPRVYETPDAEDLYREVKRSRRFKHPLSLMLVKPRFDPDRVGVNQLVLDIQRAMASRYVQARLAKFLSENLRDTDLVAIDGDDFIVLLPETTGETASQVLAELSEKAYEEMGVQLNIGLAAFPDKALTFNGLIEAARSSLENEEQALGAPGEQQIATISFARQIENGQDATAGLTD
ncbi:MAG TPA: diguanylate cyclase [Aggregatilineales bacterium]|nr:diguanylate cyclase [Chloroflexota bacterium]HOA24796.1 diguanylate cyclase [Aggregatilineales bacterium]HPV05467.1 diguanylate cyclase [Aggregatilineales bacterium]HQA67096.1 diguanylate cyclase [Aggregatilineales bacterium]HQE19409.1 diguanylate cyclase [Aggregatilineales bacterium]